MATKKVNPEKEKERIEAEEAIVAVDSKTAKGVAEQVANSGMHVDKDEVLYVSRNQEPQVFDIRVNGKQVRGVWNNDRTRVVWRVKKEDIERFESYFMIKEGRIIKA